MYPNADTASLTNYFLASQQAQRETADRIEELRNVLRQIIADAHPRHIGLLGDPNVTRQSGADMVDIQIARDLYERAKALIEADE